MGTSVLTIPFIREKGVLNGSLADNFWATNLLAVVRFYCREKGVPNGSLADDFCRLLGSVGTITLQTLRGILLLPRRRLSIWRKRLGLRLCPPCFKISWFKFHNCWHPTSVIHKIVCHGYHSFADIMQELRLICIEIKGFVLYSRMHNHIICTFSFFACIWLNPLSAHLGKEKTQFLSYVGRKEWFFQMSIQVNKLQ